MGIRRRISAACGAALAAALLSLCLIPSARGGAAVLVNRLFEASEAVNAYAYGRLPVSPESSPRLAAALLAVAGAAFGALLAASGSRLFALLTVLILAAGQAYLGLSLPPAANAALFGALGMLLMARPVPARARAAYAAALVAVTLAVGLAWPGVDAATESASERARDWLGRLARPLTGALLETPRGETEARRVHTRSLEEGGGGARPERAFRRVTLEEEEMSRPEWIDYARIVLLLLLTAAAVFLPLMPLMALGARRKKALAARGAFQSEDVNEAVCAAFRQTADWLRAMELGGGNLPYGAWSAALAGRMPADYAARFQRGAALFEEAFYSDHPLGEDARDQALALLEETERLLTARATWRQRLRLRYKECLLT